MKLNKLFLIVGTLVLFSLNLASSAVYVDDPLNCPSAPYQSQNPVVSGEQVCGYDSGVVYWYDMNLLSAPVGDTTVDSTNYGSVDGGYVLDCEAYDGSSPHCDNGGNFLCDRASACYNVNRQTTCDGGSFGSYTCATCRSGYTYCDGDYQDADGCEVRIGVTSYSSNSVYNATCGAVCASGYLDINGDGTGSDGDGCEIQIGGSCSVGALSGTYDSGGNCVVSKSYFETGTETSYSSNDPLLWGNQYGSGQLLNLTNKGTNASFAINNSGCIVFPDGSTQCEAGSGSGSGNITGSGASGRVTFWTGTSQISSSGNFFWDNTFGRLGIGTSSPTSKLSINGTVGNESEGIGFGDGDTTIYESSENQLTFNFSTIGNWIMDGTYFRSGSTGPRLRGTDSNATTPTFIPYGGDNDTGVSWVQENVLGLVAGGINVMSLANTSYVGIGTTNPVNALDVVGNINATGNVSAQYFIGDGSQLTNIDGSQISNDLNWVNYTNISQLVNDLNFLNSTNFSGSNVTANYFFGDGSQLTNIDGSQISNLNGSQINNDLNWNNYTNLSQLNNDFNYYNSTSLQNISQLENDFNYWNETYYGGIGNWTDDKGDYWNTSEDLELTTNITTTGNISASSGFFSFLGNLNNFITGFFVQDIVLNGTLSGNGSINVTGNVTSENIFVNNDLEVSGNANFTGNVTTQTDFCIEGGDCLSTVVDNALTRSFNASYFYNKTATSYTANFSAGGFVGYRAGHYICDQEFSGSHLCAQTELLLTIDQGNISNITSWTNEAWVMTGGAKYSPADVPVNDCNGFTHGVPGTYLGSFWIFNQTHGGAGGVGHCGNQIPLACCKPGGIQ